MTRSKLQFSGQSGLTGYAIIRDLSDQFFNGTTMEDFALANYATYGVSVPELESSGMYTGDVPADLPVGSYHITYKHKAGASYAQTDRVIFQELIDWDGAEIIDDLVIGSSIADICNMALSHLGVGTEIANLETETSQEAISCRRFYEQARDATLKKFPWPFATRIVALGLIAEDPTPDWKYSYRYPASALYLWKLTSASVVLDPNVKLPYKIIGDDSGRIILTNLEDASAEYISRVENPLRYTPDFIEAISYRLAAFVAPRLSSGDAFKLGEKALEMYAFTVREAQAANANEELRDDSLYESSFERARNE